MLDSPTMGAFSVLVGMSAVESASLDRSGEGGGEPLACHVVAVGEQPGEGELAGNAAVERTDSPNRAGRRASPKDHRWL